MNLKSFCVLALAILCVGPAFGFGPPRSGPIERLLFQPELIMEYRNQLALSEQQEVILKRELQDAQASIFDLKWKLNEEGKKLKVLLQATPINEEQLVTQSDNVMQLERQIKHIHLTLLARLKNMLTPQQIQKLRELRRKKHVKRAR